MEHTPIRAEGLPRAGEVWALRRGRVAPWGEPKWSHGELSPSQRVVTVVAVGAERVYFTISSGRSEHADLREFIDACARRRRAADG